MKKETLEKKLINSSSDFIIALIIIYLGAILVFLGLGLIALTFAWINTGQINPQSHLGLGRECYNYDYGDSNCFSALNFNMFWMLFTPEFTRIAFLIASISFIIGFIKNEVGIKLRSDDNSDDNTGLKSSSK